MAIDNIFEPVPPLLIALIVALLVPVVVGIPLITPVEVFIDNPAGNPEAV
jgi:hypothetical protein